MFGAKVVAKVMVKVEVSQQVCNNRHTEQSNLMKQS
jgi:hypothetical protein